MNIGYTKNFYELMMDRNIGIDGYNIYFLILNEEIIYVGQTKNVMGRIADYKHKFLNKKCHNAKLQELFDSGEIKRVVFTIKDKATTPSAATKLEKHYIREHRETCLNKYDTYFSELTRYKLSMSSKKMWRNPEIRKSITNGVSKKHILISPTGTKYEFFNSREVKSFLDNLNRGLDRRDKKRVGYQMLESFGENKGWTMKVDGKRLPNTQLTGVLKTPDGECITINGKSDLVNINRNRKYRININKLIQNGNVRGFELKKK